MSRITPDGCMGGCWSWGAGGFFATATFLDSLLGFDATAAED
jgi:hypothetical protein